MSFSVFCPHFKNLIPYLKVVGNLVSHQGVCRDSVARNKTIVKALLSYCGSYEKEVCFNPWLCVVLHILVVQKLRSVPLISHGFLDLGQIASEHLSSQLLLIEK
jgi:hypothetical protein